MSIYLALDKDSNDLIKPTGGGVSRVKDGRFLVQQLRCVLNTVLGEWVLDPSIGFLNLRGHTKHYDKFDIETRLYEVALSVEGIKRIYDVSIILERRVLTIILKAETKFGGIDLTIPWGT